MTCVAEVQMVKKMGLVWLGSQSKLATCIAWRQLGSLPFSVRAVIATICSYFFMLS